MRLLLERCHWISHRRLHCQQQDPLPTPAAALPSAHPRAEYLRGWRVKTSPVPIKAPFFSLIKSNNYLPNALNLMDAQAEEYDQVGRGERCCAWVG